MERIRTARRSHGGRFSAGGTVCPGSVHDGSGIRGNHAAMKRWGQVGRGNRTPDAPGGLVTPQGSRGPATSLPGHGPMRPAGTGAPCGRPGGAGASGGWLTRGPWGHRRGDGPFPGFRPRMKLVTDANEHGCDCGAMLAGIPAVSHQAAAPALPGSVSGCPHGRRSVPGCGALGRRLGRTYGDILHLR